MNANDLRQLADLLPEYRTALIRAAEVDEAKHIGACGRPMFCRNPVKCLYPNDTGTHCNCPR
jgi:hypothetical protein